ARGPSREPAPYHYDPAVWKTVPRDYLEDAAACILYAGSTYRIEADGTTETTTHEITRINGRTSIESLGEHRNIVYNPANEQVTLHLARVYKADGTIVEVEPRHVQVRDVSTDFLAYNQDKQLVISFPSLEVGDTFEVKWSTRGRNPEYQGQFFT